MVLITKSDFLPVLEDFSVERAELNLRNLANIAPVIQLSARRNLGLQTWFDWLSSELAKQRARISEGESARSKIQSDDVRLPLRST